MIQRRLKGVLKYNLSPTWRRSSRLMERDIGEGKSMGTRLWKGITLKESALDGVSNVPNQPQEGQKGQDLPESPPRKGIQEKFRENSVTNVTNVTNDSESDYPTHSCYACGSDDYHLTKDGRWLCSRCHPPLKEDEDQ